ncbi:MAG: flagellar biosynthesis anti-sigma factor FlgM [Lawsonibacter sp.]|jgi:anti-sigma28 factor (negative regulator of flagellin synthesis)|nr:flagellar biosynthesis anti-sigma factor FlgM [Lawsonibacter sp.]
MLVTRREGFSAAPIQTGGFRGAGAKRARAAESSFDQISLSAGQETAPAFRAMAAVLSQQVRTYNTTGKIQDLRSQVASGEYRPDARETAARMLLMREE